MVDSLKHLLTAPFGEFAKGMEAFTRDNFQLDLVVVDSDRFVTTGTTRPMYVAGLPAGEAVPRAIEVPSPHSEARAAAAQAELAAEIARRGRAQIKEQPFMDAMQATIASGSVDHYAKIMAHAVKNSLNEKEEQKDDNLRGGLQQTAGVYHNLIQPRDWRDANVDVHVLSIDASRHPQLSTRETQIENMNCAIPDPGQAYLQGMERIHVAYHEMAHAANLRDLRDFPLKKLTLDRDQRNYYETVADGFSVGMVLRDFGGDAIPYLKGLMLGHKSYMSAVDVDHYTAPMIMKMLEVYNSNPSAFSKITPVEMLQQVEEAAREIALTKAEPALLQEHRRNVNNNGPMPEALSPRLAEYEQLRITRDDVLRQAGVEMDQISRYHTHTPAQRTLLKEAEASCNAQVDMTLLKMATAQEAPKAEPAPAPTPTPAPRIGPSH